MHLLPVVLIYHIPRYVLYTFIYTLASHHSFKQLEDDTFFNIAYSSSVCCASFSCLTTCTSRSNRAPLECPLLSKSSTTRMPGRMLANAMQNCPAISFFRLFPSFVNEMYTSSIPSFRDLGGKTRNDNVLSAALSFHLHAAYPLLLLAALPFPWTTLARVPP